MPGRIKFSYRAQHDVVVAEVHWTLETEEDVLAWCQEYVNPRVASILGKHRASGSS